MPSMFPLQLVHLPVCYELQTFNIIKAMQKTFIEYNHQIYFFLYFGKGKRCRGSTKIISVTLSTTPEHTLYTWGRFCTYDITEEQTVGESQGYSVL